MQRAPRDALGMWTMRAAHEWVTPWCQALSGVGLLRVRAGAKVMSTDGRTATQPYRVRVGNVWYWVDPTAPASAIEPGDTVVIYPVAGETTLAILLSPFDESTSAEPIEFSTLEGEHFRVPRRDIAALHLAARDEEQT
jgi:hypothetical protein